MTKVKTSTVVKTSAQQHMHNRKMDFDVDAFATSTSATTLTLDLQNLIGSSAGGYEYSLSVLSELFKAFMIYCGNNICPDEQTNVADGQPKNMKPLQTLSSGLDAHWNTTSTQTDTLNGCQSPLAGYQTLPTRWQAKTQLGSKTIQIFAIKQ